MATVTVGCTLPNGLILHVRRDDEPKKVGTAGNGNPLFADNPVVKEVFINGANREFIAGTGVGMTEVDADFWARWKKQHTWFPALKSGAVFAIDQTDAASKMSASQQKHDATGLEGLNANLRTGEINDARAMVPNVSADIEAMRDR